MAIHKVSTHKSNFAVRRSRGRPPGRTAQGTAARQRLYDTAIELITKSGYEAATLREVAKQAGVSAGLLYRYFPNKRAVVLAMYDDLSAKYAASSAHMPSGKWRDRVVFALNASLETLKPHRNTLSALIPLLVGNAKEGLFARETAFSRERVQKAFDEAIAGATDPPATELIAPLARLLYLAHLAIILWWLLDKSPRQRATDALVALVKTALPAAALTLRLKAARAFIITGDKLFREALVGGSENNTPPINTD